MRRRTANTERALSPTAPRRRFGSNGDAPAPAGQTPAELNPTSSLSKVLRQRELANRARTGNSRSSRLAPAKSPEPVVNASRRVRPVATQVVIRPASDQPQASRFAAGLHPLSDGRANAALRAYEERTLGAFDRIVPLLKRIAALQHEADFISQAQRLALAELGHELPLAVLETAWAASGSSLKNEMLVCS